MLSVFIQFSSKNFAIFISIWVILQKPRFLPRPNNMTLGFSLLGFGHSTLTGKTVGLHSYYCALSQEKKGKDEALDFFTKYFTRTKCNISVGRSSLASTNAPVILGMRCFLFAA